jgi:hypothetical protein
MIYAQIISGQPVAITGDAVTFEREGAVINASYQTVMLWSDDERAAIGVYPIVDDAIPEGKVSTGSALENDNGTIRRRWVLEDIPAPTKEALLARSAECRWEKETGGIDVGGMLVPTDERTQNVLSAAFVSAMADPEFAVADWKVAPGVYTTLSNETVRTLALAVRAHVQACFSLNRTVDDGIAADEIVTFEQVSAAYQ